jgi:hypothetical protein
MNDFLDCSRPPMALSLPLPGDFGMFRWRLFLLSQKVSGSLNGF